MFPQWGGTLDGQREEPHCTMNAIQSPRIAELRRKLDAGDRTAVDGFWLEVEAAGAPLVEPVEGDHQRRLVTFVHRAERALENLVLFPGIGHTGDTHSNSLELLPGADLWFKTYLARSDLRVSYMFSPNDPLLPLMDMEPQEQTAHFLERANVWFADPLNPRRFGMAPMPEQSYVELPDAPPQPYPAKRDGVPEGTIEREDLESDPLGEGRRIWTYLPPGYDASAGPYPLVLQFDGIGSRKLGLHTTLDNMIAERILPPVVCVMMHNIDRNIELPCNEAFADWLCLDFLPKWRAKYAITNDPARSVVTGMSYGGLAAAWCGLRHPEVFGNVLSQSGSFWWGPEGTGEWQWLTAKYEASPPLPLRFYMDVGLLEDGRRNVPGYPTMVEANRALRDVLRAKGNDFHYAEFNGGHDYVSWRGTIADGLAALLGRKSE